ncbi:hypothetical protein H9P43_009255 [Blastocladiella emersonii ATCC 22665]|uniref:Alkaline phosphatase n=1 Tax=Blastocladiella emersonii TaxID=4808 RepID=A0A238HK18_BLAEM|nr:hypothetical protein H9P43_009255 [Blastocladiella emersonii ATCC 22665]SMQ44839.1 Alkaline Phosphatase [Blastocladiella emersonii]
MAREFYQYGSTGTIADALGDVDGILPLDTLLVGSARTKSSDAWVTDSASAATAFACGLKTYNAAIGVDPKQKPCATVLEAAKFKGYKTGLVATSRITHATPAGWSAHIIERDWENEIAAQQIGDNVLGRSVDVMIGGGARHFIPKSNKGSSRKDERDLRKEAVDKFGFRTVVESRAALLNVTGKDVPLLALMAGSHMDYEIDRNKTAQPSLAEMANVALTLLSEATSDCDSPGFFLMVEGSRIDHAGHSNDVATHMHDILAYQDAVHLVKSYVKANPATGALSVSDHETGGLTKGAQVDQSKDPGTFYNWHPEALLAVKMSVEKLSPIIAKAADAGIEAFVTEAVAKNLGIKDLAKPELDAILAARAVTNAKKAPSGVYPLDNALTEAVSRRAWAGWTTHGHTGMDVNLYAINAPGLRGNVDNTYLAKYSAEFLGVADALPTLTKRLANQKVTADTPVATKRSVGPRDEHHRDERVYH